MKRDLTGQTFGKLKVVRFSPKSAKRRYEWDCICECGKETKVRAESLKNGHTKSCGCLMVIHKKTHGMFGTSIYKIWQMMRQRCYNPKHVSFKDYGGRGIKVCDRWKDSFENFLEDVGDRPSKAKTIDRFPNPNGDYKPGNVRWATQKEQARNRRGNHLLTIDGKEKCVSEWAEIYRIPCKTLFERLRRGWTLEDAISRPVQKHERAPNTVK